MAKKGYGISEVGAYKPESTMSLEGKHASTVKAHKIGSKVQMMVTGTKTRASMNGDGSHSATYKVHSVKMTDESDTGGPNTKASDNDATNSDSRQ